MLPKHSSVVEISSSTVDSDYCEYLSTRGERNRHVGQGTEFSQRLECLFAVFTGWIMCACLWFQTTRRKLVFARLVCEVWDPSGHGDYLTTVRVWDVFLRVLYYRGKRFQNPACVPPVYLFCIVYTTSWFHHLPLTRQTHQWCFVQIIDCRSNTAAS